MPIRSLAAIAALSFILAAPLVPIFAQTPPPMMHGPHGGGHMNGMGDPLGLTDAQKSRMRPILMNAQQQGQAIQNNTSLTPAARQVKMRTLGISVRTQMMAILTPAQRARAKTMQQHGMQRHGM